MRRRVFLTLTVAGCGALLAGGCTPEDVQQAEARQALERHVAGDGRYTGQANCTDAAKVGYFVEQPTSTFLCAGRRADGGCDWFRLTLRDGRTAQIVPDRQNAGCTLPA